MLDLQHVGSTSVAGLDAKPVALKRDLATRPFDSVMDYTAEKGALVYESYERIFAADPEHPHTPQPLGRAATAG